MKLLLLRLSFLVFLLAGALGTTAHARSADYGTAHPDTIYVGTYFVWVYDFNLPEGSYSVKCWVWFRYKNPALKPDQFMAVFNAKEFEYSHVVHHEKDGIHWMQMNCTATIRQKWELTNFPFDKQVLRFRMAYEGADNRNIVLLSDPLSHSVYDEYNHPEGWNLIDFRTQVEPRSYKTDFGTPVANGNETTISMFMATLKVERHGWSLFFKLFSGMYAAFLIAWLSLFINPRAVDPRFGLSVGGLFATVGNKYIVDSILPEMTKDNMVDTLHSYTFLAVIACIAISVTSLYHAERDHIRRYKQIDRWSAAILMAAFVLINLIHIVNAINSAPPNFWPAK